MWKRQKASVDVAATKLALTAYQEHIRSCGPCFRAALRSELCGSGITLFDALPCAASETSTPSGLGSYGFEGLDDSMTFSTGRVMADEAPAITAASVPA